MEEIGFPRMNEEYAVSLKLLWPRLERGSGRDVCVHVYVRVIVRVCVDNLMRGNRIPACLVFVSAGAFRGWGCLPSRCS